jgi:hypothetical protein
MSTSKDELDEHLERFEHRLPGGLRGFVRWIRAPGSGLVRIPVGTGLIIGGTVGFLPIVGFWMVPLGLLIIAKDVPVVRPPMIRLFDWVERKWPSPRPPTS